MSYIRLAAAKMLSLILYFKSHLDKERSIRTYVSQCLMTACPWPTGLLGPLRLVHYWQLLFDHTDMGLTLPLTFLDDESPWWELPLGKGNSWIWKGKTKTKRETSQIKNDRGGGIEEAWSPLKLFISTTWEGWTPSLLLAWLIWTLFLQFLSKVRLASFHK